MFSKTNSIQYWIMAGLAHKTIMTEPVTAMYENEKMFSKTNSIQYWIMAGQRSINFLVNPNPSTKPLYCNDEYRRLLPEHVYKITHSPLHDLYNSINEG
ncbi:hypothetical protein ASG93_20115 [Paenibacillus sp. Soil787]|nr:hypothetical protein ASG93_20115 [Paenibacillus sp. Soil787]